MGAKKVAAEKTLLIQNFAKTSIKSQMAVYDNQRKLSERITSFNVAYSASLEILEEVLPSFLFLSLKNLIHTIYCLAIDKTYEMKREIWVQNRKSSCKAENKKTGDIPVRSFTEWVETSRNGERKSR
jgi:hypothetical protein